MEKSRGIKNIFSGLLANILTFAVGLIVPRLVLVNLGSEANGLLNSISSILSYMSLLEAGVGTASLHALFKPCANKDRNSINSIMAATDYFYRRSGKIYLLLVSVLSVVYTFIVQSELPKLDVFLVVLLCGLSGVISYFFQGKFKIYLQAEGKSYVNTNVATFLHIATSIIKAVLLYLGYGVVAIQLSSFLLNVVQVIFFMAYMKKHYPWLDMNVKPAIEAISQKNAVLVHQISGLIFNNTDVLVLTIFTSLRQVSVYSMYAMIYGMVKWLAVVLYDSYTYALGQCYETDRPRFLRLFDVYEVCTMMITFSLYCICRAMMNPFLALYTEGVNDIQYVDQYLPWLFAAFYLLHNGRTSSSMLINIAQHFEKTKWRSITESIINISVSLLCVNLFGIYGVLMGTIAALLYRANDMIIYASKLLNRSCWITYKRWLLNIGAFIICSVAIEFISMRQDNYFMLLLNAIVISILTFLIFFGINAFFERKNIGYLINIGKNIFSKFLRRLRSSY